MFSILLKLFQLKGIDSLQAIFFNYITAFILGLIFSLHGEIVVNPFKAKWFIPVVLLGFVFVAGMIMLSASTRRVGVAISTVSSRASMVIPIIVSYLFIAGSDAPKWLPICLMVVAMTLTIWTGKPQRSASRVSILDIIAPITVFLTFGLSASMLKIIQDRISVARAGWSQSMVNSELSLVTATIFFVAGILCIYSFFKKDKNGNSVPFKWKNLLGGIALGAANYFCTYTLMLSMKTIDSSILFPIHNIGIVAIGGVVGWTVFNEKMRPHQVVGIVLAAVSIVWLYI